MRRETECPKCKTMMPEDSWCGKDACPFRPLPEDPINESNAIPLLKVFPITEPQQDPVVDKSLDRELIVTDERQRIMQTLLMNARPVLTDDGDRMFRGSEVQKAVNGEYEMNGPQRFGKASDTLKYTIDRLLKESKSKVIEDLIDTVLEFGKKKKSHYVGQDAECATIPWIELRDFLKELKREAAK